MFEGVDALSGMAHTALDAWASHEAQSDMVSFISSESDFAAMNMRGIQCANENAQLTSMAMMQKTLSMDW
jgi:hypothetical protein